MVRKFVCATLVAAVVASPALALGVEDLAKVVLGGNSVLKKAETTCGTNGQLTASDNLTLTSALAAVRRTLAPDRYTALETVSRAEADTQAQAGTFCPETKKKKKGLLSKIGKAGRNILLGGLGI
jgi:hypothetical protein